MKSHARLSAYREAITAARVAYGAGDLDASFRLLERAHVLGQPWVVPHTVSHWLMLKVGWRRGDGREVRGQLLRLAAGGVLSLLGWLPEGNTGGADISPTKPMPLPADLIALCGRS
ncbi:MAG: DUF3703 domain-containing protein [Caulobacter sp.]|nr:DUF3703 domain-containing protein [Caulobacter sp.]